MLEIYTYDYIRSTNEERRARALGRYERLFRKPEEVTPRPGIEGEVVELTFAEGCPSPDQLSA